MRRDDYGDWYCENCYQECGESEHLHQYGYAPDVIEFFGGDPYQRDAPLFMGVELETDRGCNRGAYVDELHDLDGFAEHFWMTEDGSLDNGVEITGHPMTLDYPYKLRSLYEQIGDTARSHDFGSHDGGNCGLHVNVNRSAFGKSPKAQELNILKLVLLVLRFERQLTTFSRRRDNHWCYYTTYGDYTTKKDVVSVNHDGQDESVFSKAHEFMCNERDKYRAVNIRHSNRVEIRIFRGTLKWETYYASLALTEGLCKAAKSHGSTWATTVSWYDLMGEVIANVSVPECAEMLREYLESKSLL